AAVPVRWQGRMIATLVVGFADPDRLTPAEVELLDEIGRQVALGMERLRLQARVQDQQNEMAVVAERNRIARDMHDGLVQYVYALGLQLEHARDLALTEPDAVAPVLTTSIQQTNHVLSEMRTFLYQLRPIIMKEKEIGQWVLDLCRQFQQATGVALEAEVGTPAGQELSAEISIALFRIIQEALANIYKHAHASRATLSLDFSADARRPRDGSAGAALDPGIRCTDSGSRRGGFAARCRLPGCPAPAGRGPTRCPDARRQRDRCLSRNPGPQPGQQSHHADLVCR